MERIIFSDNGQLQDITQDIKSIDSGLSLIEYNHIEDYLYIGSREPFNSMYFNLSTLNTNNSLMTVEYWSDDLWQPVVDLIDGTKGFTQNGVIQFTPDRNKGWAYEDTEEDGVELITGLGDVTIYGLYWLKISFSASFSASTSLSYVGQRFCSQSDLYIEYPELSNPNLLAAINFSNFENQLILASELIVDDMVAMRMITDESQLLDWQKLKRPCIQKAAFVIFAMLGDDYKDQRDFARKEYGKRMDRDIFIIDNNANGIASINESTVRQGYIVR